MGHLGSLFGHFAENLESGSKWVWRILSCSGIMRCEVKTLRYSSFLARGAVKNPQISDFRRSAFHRDRLKDLFYVARPQEFQRCGGVQRQVPVIADCWQPPTEKPPGSLPLHPSTAFVRGDRQVPKVIQHVLLEGRQFRSLGQYLGVHFTFLGLPMIHSGLSGEAKCPIPPLSLCSLRPDWGSSVSRGGNGHRVRSRRPCGRLSVFFRILGGINSYCRQNGQLQ